MLVQAAPVLELPILCCSGRVFCEFLGAKDSKRKALRYLCPPKKSTPERKRKLRPFVCLFAVATGEEWRISTTGAQFLMGQISLRCKFFPRWGRWRTFVDFTEREHMQHASIPKQAQRYSLRRKASFGPRWVTLVHSQPKLHIPTTSSPKPLCSTGRTKPRHTPRHFLQLATPLYNTRRHCPRSRGQASEGTKRASPAIPSQPLGVNHTSEYLSPAKGLVQCLWVHPLNSKGR